jgi:hypothetical protein
MLATKIILASFLITIILAICANSEDKVFCNSVPMQVTPWTYNFTHPKFDSSMGNLTSIELSINYNLSQSIRVENMGDSNATLNSSTQSVLQIETPDGKMISVNASNVLSRDLPPFDGTSDYSGSSGINLNESSTSGTVVLAGLPTSDFVARESGEDVLLRLSAKSSPNISLSGDLSSKIKTTSGARICVSYHYEPGAS